MLLQIPLAEKSFLEAIYLENVQDKETSNMSCCECLIQKGISAQSMFCSWICIVYDLKEIIYVNNPIYLASCHTIWSNKGRYPARYKVNRERSHIVHFPMSSGV